MKKTTKNKLLQKIVIVFFIIITLFNMIFLNPSYATAVVEGVLNVGGGLAAKPFANLITALGDGIYRLFTNMVIGEEMGIFSSDDYWPKELKLDITGEYHVLAIGLTSMANYPLSIENILAGQIDLLDVNFIDSDNNDSGSWGNLRNSVKAWYRALRLLAIVGLLSILIYIGIRIMLSANSAKKAAYKQRLLDWIVAFVILFALPYIMSFTFTIIDELTELFAIVDPETGEIQTNTIIVNWNGIFRYRTNFMGLARTRIQSIGTLEFTDIIGNIIIYIALLVLTIKYFFTYLKRTFTMAFLTIISPLVAMTYPLDKVSDGQAQGFNMWLHEFIFNALLQPIQYLAYVILIGSVLSLASTNLIYTIVALLFIQQAEKLLRKIFQFGKASEGTVAAPGGGTGALAMAGALAAQAKGLIGGKGNDSSGSGNKVENQLDVPDVSEKDDDAMSLFDSNPGLDSGEIPNPGLGDSDSGEIPNPGLGDSDSGEIPNPELSDSDSGEILNPELGDSDSEEILNPELGDSDSEEIPNPELGDSDSGEIPNPELGDTDSGEIPNPSSGDDSSKPSLKNPRNNKEAWKEYRKKKWDKIRGVNQALSKKQIWKNRGKKALKTYLRFGLAATAAAVQAGISITDGKFNPMESVVTGIAANKIIGGAAESKFNKIRSDFREEKYGKKDAKNEERIEQLKNSEKAQKYFKKMDIDPERVYDMYRQGIDNIPDAVDAIAWADYMNNATYGVEGRREAQGVVVDGNKELEKVQNEMILKDENQDTYNSRIDNLAEQMIMSEEGSDIRKEAEKNVNTEEKVKKWREEAIKKQKKEYGKDTVIDDSEVRKYIDKQRSIEIEKEERKIIDARKKEKIEELKHKDAEKFRKKGITGVNDDNVIAEGMRLEKERRKEAEEKVEQAKKIRNQKIQEHNENTSARNAYKARHKKEMDQRAVATLAFEQKNKKLGVSNKIYYDPKEQQNYINRTTKNQRERIQYKNAIDGVALMQKIRTEQRKY